MSTVDAFFRPFFLSLFVVHFSPRYDEHAWHGNLVWHASQRTREKSRSLHIALVPYFCHASHVLDEIRKKILSVEDSPILHDTTCVFWAVTLAFLWFNDIHESCVVRDEIERTALGRSSRVPSWQIWDNMRTVMRLITIRRIEWQAQTYFSNIKRPAIREMGYYHDIRYIC